MTTLYSKVLTNVAQGEMLRALSRIDTFILETEGVIYGGNKLFPLSKQTVSALEQLGKNIIYYPSYTRRSRLSYQKKLHDFGITTSVNQIYTPSSMTAEYMRRFHPEIKKVYLVGGVWAAEELKQAGIKVLEVGDFKEHSNESSKLLEKINSDKDVGAVVVSFDEAFTFQKLTLSALLLERPDIMFIVTSLEPYSIVDGKKYPGVSPLIASISKVSGRKPDLVTCRPNPIMFHMLKENYPEIDPHRTCMVGDSITKDLKFANNSGILSMLTLSGITMPQQLEHVLSQNVDFVIHDFSRIYQILN
ncbi:unnamed protein product [Blepharisma stoltei]|uniref:Uncharacterized protein n=1 Tax=Blepharisma stoltei TaxID=1481888 RepID=A0AAU9J5L3_9CILI|nr:unnamed protein product [Blepharisma stoltei]